LQIILFTANAVFPLFVIIAIGSFLNKTGLLPEDLALKVNKICFTAMIPCSLFKTIYNADLSISSFKIVAYGVGIYLIVIPTVTLLIPKIIKKHSQIGAVAQGIFRSNMVLIGIPLMTNLFGEDHVGPMALLITFFVPLYVVSAVIVLTIFSSDSEGKKITAGDLVTRVFKNPMIIGAVMGIILNVLNIPLPTIIEKPVYDLAGIASPLAMLALGARFSFKSLSDNRFAVAVTVLGRLIVVPFIVVGGAVLLGFRDAELCALLICSATPTAAASAAMADAMGNDGKLAGEIVVMTSLLSALTLFVELCILQFAGFM